MNGPVAFFIDADNLCEAEGVRQACAQLTGIAGPIAVRRAYGAADVLKALAPVIKALAIQPCMTFPLSKNTTDAALVAAAMEFACEQRPLVVAIGSGDLDFYPLAVRLRERGIRVLCFSQHGKLHPEVKPAYDECYLVGKESETAPKAAVKAPVAPPTKAAPAKKAPAKKAPAKKAAAGVALPSKAAGADGGTSEPSLDDILAVVPALRNGLAVPLTDAGKLLRDAKLLSKSSSSPTLFKRFPDEFVLTPPGKQPTHVRWMPAPR